jgi:tetratricopeptide (TPR) repeat protein
MMKFDGLLTEKTGFHLLCIFIVIFIVFGNSLFFDFVWDDRPLLLGIDAYKDFKLKEILFSPANRLEYLPVRDISYSLDYLLWGRNPVGFHFTNIVLYFLNSLIVYFITLEITAFLLSNGEKDPETPLKLTAFFAALLFAVHPVHSEVVSFITSRNTLLSGMFFFTSCYFYLKFLRFETGERWRYYAISLICFVLAMFSKATSIILPLALLIFLIFKNRYMSRTALTLMPFFLISAAVFLIFKNIASESKLIVSDHTMVFGAFNFASKFAVSLQIPFFYIKKMLVPLKLSAEYTPEFSRSLEHITVIASLSGLVLITYFGVILRKKYPELIFSFLWFLIVLIPVMNFFLTHPVVADRYVYLSSYAFFFLVTALLFRAFRGVRMKWAMLFLTVVLVALSFISVERNRVWQNDKTLWEDTINVSPGSLKPYVNLGSIYFNEGDYDRAFNLFEKLKELDPSSITYDFYKGLQLFNIGDFSGTINLLNKALARNKESLDINHLLGQSYEMTGNTEKAMGSYMNVLRSNELDTAGRKDFARERLNILRESISPELDIMRNRVKENASDFNTRIKLAISLDRAGLFDEAIEHYEELERLKVDSWVLFYNMANVYKKTGDFERAELYYIKSLALNSKNANAFNNLGLVLKKLKRYDLSIKAFQDAINADRDFAYAQFNMAVLYFHLGDGENAVKYFNHVRERFPNFKERVIPYISKLRH